VERRINFLDLTTHREHTKFSIDIYRKPTFTDTIIPNDSCHPEEHKLAAVRSLYDRLDNYHLPPDRRQNEDNRIQQILQNNGYSTPALPLTSNYKKNQPPSEKPLRDRFSYCSRETRAVTKAFKNTKIKVTYSTKNTLQKLLMGNHHLPEKSKYVKSGLYQIICHTCNETHRTYGQVVHHPLQRTPSEKSHKCWKRNLYAPIQCISQLIIKLWWK